MRARSTHIADRDSSLLAQAQNATTATAAIIFRTMN
jgi:hypothetical protein